MILHRSVEKLHIKHGQPGTGTGSVSLQLGKERGSGGARVLSGETSPISNMGKQQKTVAASPWLLSVSHRLAADPWLVLLRHSPGCEQGGHHHSGYNMI